MYTSPLEKDILRALKHGPLDVFQVAADVQSAPFMVRGSLKRLKRARMVHENLTETRHDWELTPRGALAESQAELVLGADQ